MNRRISIAIVGPIERERKDASLYSVRFAEFHVAAKDAKERRRGRAEEEERIRRGEIFPVRAKREGRRSKVRRGREGVDFSLIGRGRGTQRGPSVRAENEPTASSALFKFLPATALTQRLFLITRQIFL